MDIIQVLIAGFAASIAWFNVCGIDYMNSIINKSYKKYRKESSVKDCGETCMQSNYPMILLFI